MSYLPVTLKELRSLAEALEQSYTVDNPKRFNHIALLKKLTQITNVNAPAYIKLKKQLQAKGITNPAELEIKLNKRISKILLGAAVFVLESLRNECYFEPRSTLYNFITRHLKISKINPLHEDDRLVYMNKFYKHQDVLFSDQDLKDVKNVLKEDTRKKATAKLNWDSRISLSEDIKYQLTTVRAKDRKRINFLVHASPELIALQKNIKKINEQYKAEVQKRWRLWANNPKRDAMMQFISAVDKHCMEYYGKLKEIDQMQKLDCETRKGLLLYALLKIESEYGMLSPGGGYITGGSELYKICLEVLNIKGQNSYALDFDDKINWLKALSDHITIMKSDPRYQSNTELDKFKNEIDAFKIRQEDEKREPTYANRIIATGVSLTAQYWMSCAIAAYGMTVAQLGIGALASFIGGPTGTVIYFGGGMMMSSMGRFVSAGAMTFATAALYTVVLERLGRSIGNTTAGLISYAFTPTKEGFERAINKLSPYEKKAFRAWVNTLLEMPVEVVPEIEKEHIRIALGIEKGCNKYVLPENPNKEELPKVTFFNDKNEMQPAQTNPAPTNVVEPLPAIKFY